MSNFHPNRIKFLLEAKGYARPTDNDLAKMIGVKKDTIARWKTKSPEILDRISDCVFSFSYAIQCDNHYLCAHLGYSERLAYTWNKQRPKLLIRLALFFEATGIKFEEIYNKC